MSYGHLGAPSAWGKLPLNGSSSNSVVSSEMARHMISLYFCKVCNVQCSDEFKFEEHRRGKKHRGKVWKQKVMTFCNVCKVQCNSEQMLANHLTGKKHQKNASLMGLIWSRQLVQWMCPWFESCYGVLRSFCGMAATISFVISTTYFDIYVCCYDMLQCYYVVTFTLTKVQPPIPSSFLLR